MTELNLQKIREDIDNIDTQLVELFRERMEKSIQVAQYKQAHGLPILNSAREQEVLNKVTEQMGEPFGEYAKHLFNTIFELSKDAQKKYMDK
jgi:monofunctional chorismate mutase